MTGMLPMRGWIRRWGWDWDCVGLGLRSGLWLGLGLGLAGAGTTSQLFPSLSLISEKRVQSLSRSHVLPSTVLAHQAFIEDKN